MSMTFTEKVYQCVQKIPAGETLSYKEVAEKIGRPKAIRAVGQALARNYDPKVPCHRVIKNDDSLGHYNRGGTRVKRKLLKKEGAL